MAPSKEVKDSYHLLANPKKSFLFSKKLDNLEQLLCYAYLFAARPAKNGHNKDKNVFFVQFSECANLKKDRNRNLQP